MLSHHMAICDFRLALELAAERSSLFSPPVWVSERDCRRSPIAVLDGNSRISVIPDGVFSLAVIGQDIHQTFRVEVDRATIVSPIRLKQRMRGYLLEMKHRRARVAPVLFVVPTPARQVTIAHWVAEEAQATRGDPTLFWITTAGQTGQHAVLDGPIWEIVGVKAPVSIRSLAAYSGPEPARHGFPVRGVVVG
jgi:hypothetical protein